MRLLVFLLLCGIAADAADRCSPPPALADFVDSLPADNRSKRRAIEKRILETPDDIALHRVYVDTSVYAREPARVRYRLLLESHPNELDYQYVYARSLVGSDTKQALKLYGRILEKDPDYPWVHISQLEIYRAEAFRDRTKLEASMAAIQRVCSASLVPYRYLTEVSDNEAAARGAAKLRALLVDSKDPRDLRLYSTLWAVEFRVRPASEDAEERMQVAEDMKRILPFENDPTFLGVLQSGARLTRDKELSERLDKTRKPDNDRLVMTQSNAWIREHPRPKAEDSAEIRHAYGKALLAKTDEWQKLTAANIITVSLRVQGLIWAEASPEEIGRTGDEMLEVIRREEYGTMFAWMVSLARLYLDGGVLLDRIPALCGEAIRKMDDPEAVIEIDLAPSPRTTSDGHDYLINRRVEAQTVLAQLHEKRGETGKAHDMLLQASEYLASQTPAEARATARYQILRTGAEFAEQEGRKLDALNGYRDALTARPIAKAEILARQRKLWNELGGTEEGWKQWEVPISPTFVSPASAPANTQPASAEGRQLPPLSVRDSDGTQWTLDRFAGKTVVAVVWATWCEPCRNELPYFAKLEERVKGRSDVLAISFNTDANFALAQEYMQTRKFTFPALSAMQYADDVMKTMAIPRTWIIRNGVITKERIGFGGDGDQWVESILALLR